MNDTAERLYERVLIVRCQAGDGEAVGEIVGRYAPRLRYFLRKLLGPGHDPEDVLQDVWLDMVRGVSRLNDPSAFPAWIYRLARDRASRVLRRTGRPSRSIADDDRAVPADDGDFLADDAARVHAGLDRLDHEHREVLVLRFLEAMPYDAIARVIDRPIGTVRSRLHHAKRALRRILDAENSP